MMMMMMMIMMMMIIMVMIMMEGLHMIVQGLSKVYEGNGEGWFEVLKYLALPIFKIERCIAADEKFS